MERLYCEIEKRSRRYAYYVFFDTKDYLADQLFIRHKVRVWFGDEYRKEGSPYVAIFCHVRKRDVPEFLAALEELKNSMLICGYTDYKDSLGSLLERIEKHQRNGTACSARTSLFDGLFTCGRRIQYIFSRRNIQ